MSCAVHYTPYMQNSGPRPNNVSYFICSYMKKNTSTDNTVDMEYTICHIGNKEQGGQLKVIKVSKTTMYA